MGMWGVEGQREGAEAEPGAWGSSPGRGTDPQMDCATGREGEQGLHRRLRKRNWGQAIWGTC